MAGAIIASGVLGAAGSVGGGALNKQSTSAPISTAGLASGGFDPAVSAATFDALLQLGIVDPTVLQQASPLRMALAEFSQQPLSAAARRASQRQLGRILDLVQQQGGIDELRAADEIGPHAVPSTGTLVDRLRDALSGGSLLTGSDRRLLDQIGALAGTSFDELLNREAAFQEQVSARVAEAQATADIVRQGRLSAMEQLGQMGDLESITGTELERLTRLLDERETDILRSSNIAGVNPGRQLARLEEFRQDADVEALARAVALVGSRQSVLSGVIDPATRAAQNISGTRVGSQIGATGLGSSARGPSVLGSGVAAGASSLANAFTEAALQSRGPAVEEAPYYIRDPFYD